MITSEEDLWRSFRDGSEPAFATLYRTYFYVLYAYGYHIAREEELVKDCIQNLFIELWKSRRNLSDTTSIKFYLLKAMRRKVVQAIRQKTPYLSTDDLSDFDDLPVAFSPEFDLIADQTSAEQREKLLHAINQLTNRQKEAVVLLYIEGLSYAEVASLMSLKVRSVYNLIHEALEALKKLLIHPTLWIALALVIVR
jgi:RNA polymerase sigma factor (sigma-70 family)